MVIRETRSHSLALSVSPSPADSTYLSLSLLLLGDPFLGNVLAGAGAASSLCIPPPAKQAPKPTCRPSSAFLCLAPSTPPLAPALSNHYLARQRQHAGLHLQISFLLIFFFLIFPPVVGSNFFFFFKRRVYGGENLCITICITLKFTLFFWPPGGLLLQESGCWKRDRLLSPGCPLLLPR